jgi:hypothetical protein
LQRLIDDREPLLALHEVDIGNAEQGAQLVVGDLHRAGRWRTAGRRQRCKLGLEGIVSKRKDSAYRSGRSPDWLKMKNANAPAVKREAEEDWGKEKWR